MFQIKAAAWGFLSLWLRQRMRHERHSSSKTLQWLEFGENSMFCFREGAPTGSVCVCVVLHSVQMFLSVMSNFNSGERKKYTWLIGYRWRFHVCLWSTELFKDFPFKPKDNTRFNTFKTHDCMKDEGCYYMGSGTRQLTLLYVNVCILHLMTVDAAFAHVLCADYAIISKDYNIAQWKRFCCSSF